VPGAKIPTPVDLITVKLCTYIICFAHKRKRIRNALSYNVWKNFSQMNLMENFKRNSAKRQWCVSSNICWMSHGHSVVGWTDTKNYYRQSIYITNTVADPEISKGGRSGKGGPTPEIAKKLTYSGSQILSFTNILWWISGEKGGPGPLPPLNPPLK
jgi:hypothetical protein